jgi:hypothetical protein
MLNSLDKPKRTPEISLHKIEAIVEKILVIVTIKKSFRRKTVHIQIPYFVKKIQCFPWDQVHRLQL